MSKSTGGPDLRQLQRLCVAMAIEASPRAVGEALLRGLLEIAGADAALVALRDELGAPGPLAGHGLNQEERAGLLEALEPLCAARALSQPLTIPVLESDSRFAALPASLGSAGLLLLPLAKGDCALLGAALLLHRPPSSGPDESVREEVEMLVSQAATAVENARLQGQLRERAERTEVLNEIARALAITPDVGKVFSRITGAMRRLIAFDLVTLVSVEEDKAQLLAFEATDYPAEVGIGTEVPVPELFAQLAADRRARIFDDLEGSDHPSWQRMAQAGIRSAMAAPLISGSTIPAVLVVGTRAEQGYGERERSNLQALADQIAPAIEGVRLQQALRESRAMYETLLHAVPDPVTVTDLEGRITFASERAVRQHGAASVEELIGRNAFELIAPEQVDAARHNAMRTLQEGHSGAVEYEVIDKTGARRHAELTAALVPGAAGAPRGFIAITRDITARKEAERRVAAYQQQLRSLASELSLAEERQRRRIAAELHDEISQTLVLVKLKLVALRDKQVSVDELDELRDIVDLTLGRVQSLIWEISSPILTELGLEAALQWLADKLSRSHGLAIHVHDDVAAKPLADDLRLVLFQAVRELLVNVSKHAEARAADVHLRCRGHELEIEVADEGVGFDPTDLGTNRANRGGFGLFNIRERLGYLGGRLEIDSRPGSGTRVRLIAPLGADT